MNLFEKHLKKKDRRESEDVTEIQSDEGQSTEVKKLENGTDVSFFRSDSSTVPAEEPKTDMEEYTPPVEIKIQNALDLLNRETKPVSTGLPDIDRILGGGLEPRAITEVYGSFASGKTQFCFQCTAQVLREGGKVIFVDTEGTFRPSRILDFIKDMPKEALRNILTVEAHNTDQQLRISDKIRENLSIDELSLVVVDSLTALFRAEYIGEDLQRRQQLINRHLRDLLSLAIEYDIPILVTNQVMGRKEKGEWKNVAAGGNIVAHGTTHRLEFKTEHDNLKLVMVRDSPNLASRTAKFRITSEGLV